MAPLSLSFGYLLKFVSNRQRSIQSDNSPYNFDEVAMTNYNEQGQEYVSYAYASGVIAYGTLMPQGESLVAALHQEIIQKTRDKCIPALIADLQKLLSRLDTVFYYSSRVSHYLGEIEALPAGAGKLGANISNRDYCPPLQIMRNHKELGMEFESLILHSVAALDTLSNLFADHCHGCEILNSKGKPIQIYFKDAQEALTNSLASDGRAQHLLNVLKECEPTLHNIVLSIGKKTLRNQLAHEAPIADLTESNFVIHWLPNGTVLRFDHEVYGMPLVASAKNLIQTVSYLVVKSVAILLATSSTPMLQEKIDAAQGVTSELCEPSWINPVISWRDYVSTDTNDPEFTVSKSEADGFTIQNVRLRPEVFKNAVPFDGRR